MNIRLEWKEAPFYCSLPMNHFWYDVCYTIIQESFDQITLYFFVVCL